MTFISRKYFLPKQQLFLPLTYTYVNSYSFYPQVRVETIANRTLSAAVPEGLGDISARFWLSPFGRRNANDFTQSA